MSRILIVEDEAGLASALATLVRRMGHEPTTVPSAALAFSWLERTGPDLVVLDIGLPDLSGIEVLARIRRRRPDLPVLIVTAHGNLQNAVEAKKRGASAYLVKPLDLDEFQAMVRSLLDAAERPSIRAATGQATTERATTQQADQHSPLLIGSALAMQPAFAAIAHACGSDVPVLISGPTGIGKSLTARIIHLHSARHAGSFATLSCASVPEDQLEAELFGLERGAEEARPGHLERAAGGTLLLDEIGELPPALQVKLLRVVEEKSYQRVGGREDLRVDLRILATTHQDLRQAVTEKRFREDLLYRLRVLEVALPPLAERSSDLPALCSFLLAEIGGARQLALSEQALRVLRGHDWPGNVRELRNTLEYAAAVCNGAVVLDSHLPEALRRQAGPVENVDLSGIDAALHEWLDARLRDDCSYAELHQELETRLLAALLPRFEGKQTLLARELGINRATLRKKIRGLVDPSPSKDGSG